MTWVVVSGARVDLGQIVMARFFFFARLLRGLRFSSFDRSPPLGHTTPPP